MNVRRTRWLLWVASAAFGAAGASILVWIAIHPIPHESIAYTAPLDPHGLQATANGLEASGQLLQLASEINLRRTLHDAPPPAPTPAPPPKPVPPLDIRLTGTICEPGHSQAMIQLPDGTVELNGIGDSPGNARILDIREDSITVEYNGTPQVLAVAKDEGGQ